MTVNAVRLNHAVLFVADLERSIAFYQQAFGMDGRGARAARQRRLPAPAPLRQPPRPRPVRRRRPAAAPARLRSGSTTWPGRSTPSRSSSRPGSPWPTSTRYTGESSHGATKSVYGHDPDGNEFEVMWMLPQGQLGRVRERRTGRAPRPARRGAPLGRRPHRRRARPAWTRDERRPTFAPAGRRDARRRPTRPRRWSCCCTAAARTSSEILVARRRTCRPAPAYAAVRAPIAEGGGFAWFANRGIGRPVAESLRGDDGLVPRLARRRRARPAARWCWSGSAAAPRSPAAWCSTTPPATPAPRSSTARCRSTPASRSTPAGSPTCPCSSPRATPTTVIPRELLDRTWDYLLAESGAPTVGAARPRRPRHHGPDRSHRWATGSPDRLGVPRPLTARPRPGHADRRRVADAARRRAARTGAGPRPQVSLGHPAAAAVPERPADAAGASCSSGSARCPAWTSAPRASPCPARAASPSPSARGPDDAFLVAARSASSPTCTRPTTAPCTWPCRRSWPPTSSPTAGACPIPWAGTRLSPGFVMLFGPRDPGRAGDRARRRRHRAPPLVRNPPLTCSRIS